MKERDHLEDPGVEVKNNIKVDLKKIASEGVGCFCLARVRDKCVAVVNAVMSLHFHKMRGNS
jgi:hypothetical protein